jgi:hypothetical protein
VLDVEIGHHVSTVAHLGNIAFRSGEKIVWDPVVGKITNHPAANQLVGVKYRKPWSRMPDAGYRMPDAGIWNLEPRSWHSETVARPVWGSACPGQSGVAAARAPPRRTWAIF